MKTVIQRVSGASVRVDGSVAGQIGRGLLIFLGIGQDDTEAQADYLADKIAAMRIFQDENDKMNLSLRDVGGQILVVSQFTLFADCRRGNRPNFMAAGSPDIAEPLYNYFTERLRSHGFTVETGVFGAAMDVSLCNDGPVTILLDK